ncbi:MAG TPA: enoyl-CoA hydratase/isomerase family protein [Burkholderiales bacterium]|nr:enoyl-CoA hydratase/isomerase family protein [Burkholderiales bacterium]
MSGEGRTSGVLLAEDRGRVRLLTLNRPEKLNALNNALTEALVGALEEAERDPAVSVVVLAGAGRAFCAGADVSEFKDLTPDQAERVERRAALTMRLHAVFSQMSRPVIAALRGAAMGGGAGLALACDLVVASENAQIGYPEIRHGILPAIVLANLTRQVGRKAAFELVATGAPLGARRAWELGAVNRVVADEKLIDEALALAATLAGHDPAALFAIKRLFHTVAELPLAAGLEEGRKANVAMRALRAGRS